jgi:putative photosynthetic complex assembly protein
MRGLARDRKLRGVPQGDPYRLIQYSTGRLTLSDPGTRLVVDLAAFGPTNQASFARFLNTPPAGSAKP